MSEILDGLFLGSFVEASDESWLMEHHITHILNMAKELPECFPGKFQYKKIPLEDSENCRMTKHFPEIIDFIDRGLQSQGTVLVHCMVGISRSVAAVILYLMEKKNMSCAAARQFVKDRRKFAKPNNGFITQLINHELVSKKDKKKPVSMSKRRKELLLSTQPIHKVRNKSSAIAKPDQHKPAPVDKTSEPQIIDTDNLKSSLEKKWKKSDAVHRSGVKHKQDLCARLAFSLNFLSSKNKSMNRETSKEGGRYSYQASQRNTEAADRVLTTPRKLTDAQLFQSESQNNSSRMGQKSRYKAQDEVYSTQSSLEQLVQQQATNNKLTPDEKIQFFKCRNTMESVPKLSKKKPKQISPSNQYQFHLDFTDKKTVEEFGLDKVKLKFRDICKSIKTKSNKPKTPSEARLTDLTSNKSITLKSLIKTCSSTARPPHPPVTQPVSSVGAAKLSAAARSKQLFTPTLRPRLPAHSREQRTTAPPLEYRQEKRQSSASGAAGSAKCLSNPSPQKNTRSQGFGIDNVSLTQINAVGLRSTQQMLSVFQSKVATKSKLQPRKTLPF